MTKEQKEAMRSFLDALKKYTEELESAIFIPNHSGRLKSTLKNLQDSMK